MFRNQETTDEHDLSQTEAIYNELFVHDLHGHKKNGNAEHGVGRFAREAFTLQYALDPGLEFFLERSVRPTHDLILQSSSYLGHGNKLTESNLLLLCAELAPQLQPPCTKKGGLPPLARELR
jgi:hypothetical protein